MTSQFTFGDFHLILLHFPIVWITTAFICDLIYLFNRNPVIAKISDWLVIAAALIAIPTVLTGLILSDWKIDSVALLYHRNWASATLTYTIIHAFFRFYALIKDRAYPSSIILSLINLTLIDLTADYGGFVAFGVGFFV